MPRLEPYEQQVKQQGQVTVSADASAFGGQTAKAASAFGNEAGNTADVVNAVDEAKSRIRAAAQMTNADLDWREKMISMQNDPEFTTKYGVDGSAFADSFKDEFETFAKDQIGTADPRDRKYVEQGMYNLGESLMSSAMSYQAEVGAAFASDTLTKSIDNGANSARLSPDQYTSILANATLGVNTAAHLDPTIRRRFTDQATQSITTGAALGRLEKGGAGAAQQIIKGTMQFTTLDAQGKPVNKKLSELVDAQTFNMLTNQAETKIKEAKSAANQVLVDMKSDIETSIEMAETPDDFVKIGQMIDSNAKLFKHTDVNEMTVKLYKKSKDIRDDYDSVDRGSAFASGNAYLNPANADNVKDYNNYYDKRVAPTLPNMEPNERNTYLANMVAKSKIIPNSLKGDISVAARSTDPKLIGTTADFVDRLRVQNPHLIQDLDQKDLARIDMVNSKLASGLTPSEAMNQVDTALDVNNKAIFDSRAEALKEAKIDYQSLAMKNFQSNPLVRALPGPLGEVDKNSNFATRQITQMTSEYRAAYETQFKITGDKTASEKYANQVISGSYGVTKINGRSQVMRYAPEKYFGIGGDDSDWMKKQMTDQVNELLSKGMQAPGTTADDVVLTPVPSVTSRSAKEGRPLYKLMLKTQEGGFTDLLGPNKFFTFDPQKRTDELLQAAKDAQGAKDKATENLGIIPTGAGIR